MENDPTLNYGFSIGAVIMTLGLYVAMVGAAYARCRYKGLRLPWHVVAHDVIRRPWALYVFAVWMVFLILGFVYASSSVTPNTQSTPMTFVTSTGQTMSLDASVTSDETFAKGRSTFLTVEVQHAKPATLAANATATVMIMQDSALKLIRVVHSDDETLASGRHWDYIATPRVGGHSEMALIICARWGREDLGCDDWAIPIYVQDSIIPPGLINISNWSALVGLLTSGIALFGAASQLRKRRPEAAVAPESAPAAVLPAPSSPPVPELFSTQASHEA
jgi:hypothetical protein